MLVNARRMGGAVVDHDLRGLQSMGVGIQSARCLTQARKEFPA